MIKKFNKVIPHFLQVVILVVLVVYYLYNNLNLNDEIFDMLRRFLPALFTMGAVLYLLSKKKMFASHIVLFLIAYLRPGTNALSDVLSFDFSNMQMNVTINLQTIIYLLIFIYLILIILSYLLNNQVASSSKHKGKTIILVFLSLILVYLANGINVGLLLLITPFISIAFGTQIASLLLILAVLIDIPFQLIIHIMENSLFDQTLGFYVFSIIGLILIFYNVKYLFKYK